MSDPGLTVHLLDLHSGQGVEAELIDSIGEQQLIDWETKWQPALFDTLKRLAEQGVPRALWPQSRHWDWPRKVAEVKGLLAFRGLSLISEGVTQGLMRVDLNQVGRDSSQLGKPLVYVDYLEAAPWNRPDCSDAPRFRGIGSALMTAAILLSQEEGFHGRVGLHSLPQSERFYRDSCRMIERGPDPEYDNLVYFEMTSEQATAFLADERR